MARSEGNKITGKVNFPDLNMTQYPDQIDSNKSTDAGYNENMRGFENRKDYNMAEHVNALADAVISIQRTLGIRPFVDKDGVNRSTVANRVTILENKDYDARYGGVGWNTTETIVSHTHDGSVGGPSKINLVNEVSGKLNQQNINLDYLQATSLTAAELAMSHESSVKVEAAINDKLSMSQGGVIKKDLVVQGRLNSRFAAEAQESDRAAGIGTLVADQWTKTGQALKLGAEMKNYRFLRFDNRELEYGKYVAMVRIKTNMTIPTETVLRIQASSYSSTTQTWLTSSLKDIKASDFNAAHRYETFYMVFDHETDSDMPLRIDLWRMGTDAAIELSFDYLYITPVHPAIYDK